METQWDYEKNINIAPQGLGKTSNKKVWWRCKEGHSWKTSIQSRTQGNNCPICSKVSTSIPEQTIYYYLIQVIDCNNRDKTYGMEFDIFIPSKKVAIEYDGNRYHVNEKSFKICLSFTTTFNLSIVSIIHLLTLQL